MSEKTRKKKDGEDKNKNNQRMREVNDGPDNKNTASGRQDKTGSGQEKNTTHKS